jgi:hypothetical protein
LALLTKVRCCLVIAALKKTPQQYCLLAATRKQKSKHVIVQFAVPTFFSTSAVENSKLEEATKLKKESKWHPHFPTLYNTLTLACHRQFPMHLTGLSIPKHQSRSL